MTGKLADTVMSVRNGEQIARKYQPVVYNPSSTAQVAQRAKLKLLSQLSAVLGSRIAIPKVGAVSARNLFTKVNFPITSYADSQATIDLTAVQLTKSAVSLPPISATRNAQNPSQIDVSLSRRDADVSRVVYVALFKENDGRIRYADSVVVEDAGDAGVFNTTMTPGANRAVVVLAYGVRDNTDAARAKFGNLTVVTSEVVAKIVVTRSLTDADITLTETVGADVPTV